MSEERLSSREKVEEGKKRTRTFGPEERELEEGIRVEESRKSLHREVTFC